MLIGLINLLVYSKYCLGYWNILLDMIREVKCDKRIDKKGGKKKNSGRKTTGKRTKKQVGGNNTRCKDNFEITSLTDVDTSKYSISRYVNANIDWNGLSAPPTDCAIM